MLVNIVLNNKKFAATRIPFPQGRRSGRRLPSGRQTKVLNVYSHIFLPDGVRGSLFVPTPSEVSFPSPWASTGIF
jgi:hypothetical protein